MDKREKRERYHRLERAGLWKLAEAMMDTLRKQWRNEKYAETNCVLCHGEGAMQGKFAMPSDALPKLDVTDSFANHDPKWLEFMAKEVTPKMVGLLGAEPYNMETQQGFGCFACHMPKQ